MPYLQIKPTGRFKSSSMSAPKLQYRNNTISYTESGKILHLPEQPKGLLLINATHSRYLLNSKIEQYLAICNTNTYRIILTRCPREFIEKEDPVCAGEYFSSGLELWLRHSNGNITIQGSMDTITIHLSMFREPKIKWDLDVNPKRLEMRFRDNSYSVQYVFKDPRVISFYESGEWDGYKSVDLSVLGTDANGFKIISKIRIYDFGGEGSGPHCEYVELFAELTPHLRDEFSLSKDETPILDRLKFVSVADSHIALK